MSSDDRRQRFDAGLDLDWFADRLSTATDIQTVFPVNVPDSPIVLDPAESDALRTAVRLALTLFLSDRSRELIIEMLQIKRSQDIRPPDNPAAPTSPTAAFDLWTKKGSFMIISLHDGGGAWTVTSSRAYCQVYVNHDAIAWAARGSTLAAQNAAHQTGADRAILFLAGVIAHTLTHHLRMYISNEYPHLGVSSSAPQVVASDGRDLSSHSARREDGWPYDARFWGGEMVPVYRPLHSITLEALGFRFMLDMPSGHVCARVPDEVIGHIVRLEDGWHRLLPLRFTSTEMFHLKNLPSSWHHRSSHESGGQRGGALLSPDRNSMSSPLHPQRIREEGRPDRHKEEHCVERFIEMYNEGQKGRWGAKRLSQSVAHQSNV